MTAQDCIESFYLSGCHASSKHFNSPQFWNVSSKFLNSLKVNFWQLSSQIFSILVLQPACFYFQNCYFDTAIISSSLPALHFKKSSHFKSSKFFQCWLYKKRDSAVYVVKKLQCEFLTDLLWVKTFVFDIFLPMSFRSPCAKRT